MNGRKWYIAWGRMTAEERQAVIDKSTYENMPAAAILREWPSFIPERLKADFEEVYKSTSSRNQIIKALTDLGIVIDRLEYEAPQHIGMGDYTGGWKIDTSIGSYGAMFPETIIEYFTERSRRVSP